MKNEEIKSECNLQYKQIEKAQARLEELRKICTHENTFEGMYSWRVGSMNPAIMCSDCGSVVRLNDFEFKDARGTIHG